MTDDDDEIEIPQVVAYATAHHPEGILVQLTFARTGEKLEKRELETILLGFGTEIARQLASVLERETRPDRHPPEPRPPSSRH